MLLRCVIFFVFLTLNLSVQAKTLLVHVEKAKHQLRVLEDEKEIATFHVVFGPNPQGHKQYEGDGRTPEGRYSLDYKTTQSYFYKAFHISYPNAVDIANAKKLKKSPGGAILIHGQRNGNEWAESIVQKLDWTLGCIALTNSDMDKLWKLVPAGTAIQIDP